MDPLNQSGNQSGNQFGNQFGHSRLSYEQPQELLPGYVMGSLDIDEMNAVEYTLQQQEDLLRYRDELELASQSLAYAAPHQPMPSHLKVNVMQRIHAEQAEMRSPLGAPLRKSVPRPTLAARPNAPMRPLPTLPPPPRPLAGWLQGLIGLAAVGATAFLLWSNVQLRTLNSQLSVARTTQQSQIAALQTELQNERTQADSEVQTLRQKLSALQSRLALAESQVVELQANNKLLISNSKLLEDELLAANRQNAILATVDRAFALSGLSNASAAHATFFVGGNAGLLSVSGLAPLPSAQTYQFWFIPPDGDPRPATTFLVEAESSLITIPIPTPQNDFSAVGVSIEPTGGSQTPTDVVLLGTSLNRIS